MRPYSWVAPNYQEVDLVLHQEGKPSLVVAILFRNAHGGWWAGGRPLPAAKRSLLESQRRLARLTLDALGEPRKRVKPRHKVKKDTCFHGWGVCTLAGNHRCSLPQGHVGYHTCGCGRELGARRNA